MEENLNKMVKKWYTEEGFKGLLTKTKSLIKVYNDNKFPIRVMILDFGWVNIKDRSHCEERIKQMCIILGVKFKKIKEKTKDKQGNIIEKEVII